MDYVTLTKSNIKISRIALGTWVLSGDVWGKIEEKNAINAIHAALDCGVNLIDTAPIYGYGAAEILIGKAIKNRKRSDVFLATKCGLVGRGRAITHNLSPDSIRKELANSLSRLKTDYIDLYQCHWPDPTTPIEDTMIELLKLKMEGKIHHIGVSNFDLALLKRTIAVAPIFSVQNQLSLLEQKSLTEVLPFCKNQQIAFFAYGPMAGGILSGKYSTKPKFPGKDVRSFFYKYYSGESFERIQTFVDELRTLNHPLNQLALNWVRQQTGVTSVLVGCRNPDQVKQNIEAANWRLTNEELTKIQEMTQQFK